MKKGCGKNIDGWNRCGVMEMGGSLIYCDECKAIKIRDNGYYWVKFQDRDSESDWVIMAWDSGLNEFVLNGEYGYEDDELIEIDERRIVRK